VAGTGGATSIIRRLKNLAALSDVDCRVVLVAERGETLVVVIA
jgi:hypothetical protein